MNSTVTRGRGEMVVTGTGMATEVGQISGMLAGVQQEKTPLTRQLDQLTVLITVMAAAALALVIILGLLRGDDFDELFVIGIALAIAAIPTGLPAVVTTMLSLGTQALAAKGAIVKRLRSVETLGSTPAICSDKTGTLTLNQMTARELVVVGRRYAIEGEGYRRGEDPPHRGRATSLDAFLPPMAPSNDAQVRDGEIVGDPTEAALVAGREGRARRRRERRLLPRVGEVPFDSSTSSWRRSTRWRTTAAGRPLLRQGRTRRAARPLVACQGRRRRCGGRGRRPRPSSRRTTASPAKGCACSPSPRATSTRRLRRRRRPARGGAGPDAAGPRRHRRSAAQGGAGRDRLCKAAGIQVRMITGDHATTAAAIAAQLGIEGRALPGTAFAALSDDELGAQVGEIGVVARVAPEDKVRLVEMLKRQGNVVAMTGDGVNDAPALKRSDIGVAMGITGPR